MPVSVLSASCTNTSNILSITVSDSHVAPTASAAVVAETTSLSIGDSVTIRLGYVGDDFRALVGYVKEIEYKEPERTYTITVANVLIRAVDFFIASSTPDNPFTRSNISAEDLVEDILNLAGLTNFTADPTSFTFAVHNPVEVNLTPAYDYCHFIANILAYNLYADNDGQVHFANRRPYPVGGDPSVYTIAEAEIIDATHSISDRDLRNKIIVYGSGNIHAEASAVSPYLPAGFYKTVVVAAPGVIDTQSMASQSASYNLDLMNKLTEKISVTIEGKTDLEARQCVTIAIPSLNITSIKAYIYAIEHNWSRSGYVTSMELRV